MPIKSGGVIGIKISCSAREGASGFDGELAKFIVSFTLKSGREVQVGVPLYGKNYKGPDAPPGVGGGERGETTREVAERLMAALDAAALADGVPPTEEPVVKIEARTIFVPAIGRGRGGGGGGGGAVVPGGGGRHGQYDYYIRLIIPDATSVDAGAIGDAGKTIIAAFSPVGGGGGWAPTPPTPKDPSFGWWGPPGGRPHKGGRCEPPVGPGGGDVQDEQRYLEDQAPPRVLASDDPFDLPTNKDRDTGWNEVGRAG